MWRRKMVEAVQDLRLRQCPSRVIITPVNEWTVIERDAGMRLDAWLAAREEIGSRGRARDALERGKVFVNGSEVVFSDGATAVRAGDRVGFWPDRPGSARPRTRNVVEARSALRVVHEDEHLVVVDKPPGVLVEPLPGERQEEVTLVDLLADRLRGRPGVRPLVVHRIDRDTSGLVLFALTPQARDRLKAQFERRTPVRVYLAVVHGHVTPTSATWRDKLVWDKAALIQKVAHVREERAKDAVAHYRVIEQHREAAVIEVTLVTGKRNQIRVQAGLRGYPLVGEKIYTRRKVTDEGHGRRSRQEVTDEGHGRRSRQEVTDEGHGRRSRTRVTDGGHDRRSQTTVTNGGYERARQETVGGFPRQALHAARLGFTHPGSGRHVEFEADVPDDLLELIGRLRET
jgi:23S rRNA pseudouridine1911/1915/1917 synthase